MATVTYDPGVDIAMVYFHGENCSRQIVHTVHLVSDKVLLSLDEHGNPIDIEIIGAKDLCPGLVKRAELPDYLREEGLTRNDFPVML